MQKWSKYSLTPLPALPSSADCYLSGAFLSFFSCTFYALRMNSSIPSAWNRVLHQICYVKYLMLIFFFYTLVDSFITLVTSPFALMPTEIMTVSACSFSHVHPCSPNISPKCSSCYSTVPSFFSLPCSFPKNGWLIHLVNPYSLIMMWQNFPVFIAKFNFNIIFLSLKINYKAPRNWKYGW